MVLKRWKSKAPITGLCERLKSEYKLPALLAEVVSVRGLDGEILTDFFSTEPVFSDPFLISDMFSAVERINLALEASEKIAVYGDYDADGVTAAVLLSSYLDAMGGDVITYIPSREGEGYGLSRDAIDKLAAEEVSLIITVDNGISAIDEARYCEELGISLVITDHHLPGSELPYADAIIDPKKPGCTSPYKDYCGVSLVFKLLCALEDGEYLSVLSDFADIISLGIVADVVPVTGEHRHILRAGIHMLKCNPCAGLSELMRSAGVNHITPDTLAYTLAPRINAAGRTGSAYTAFNLLKCEDEEQAHTFSEEVCAQNKHRQEIETAIISGIDAQIDKNPALLGRRVLCFVGEDWHHGVIGIVCARMVSRYGKPCLIISGSGNELRGSGRSIEGFSLHEGLLHCRELLIRFGGHTLAVGFSIDKENIPAFFDRLEAYAAAVCPLMPSYSIDVDVTVSPAALTLDSIRALTYLEPYGMHNERPVIRINTAVIQEIIPLSEGKHTRLRLCLGREVLSALLFGVSPSDLIYEAGESVDILVNAEINEYKGEERVSLIIKDIRPSEFDEDAHIEGNEICNCFKRGETLTPEMAGLILPSRDDIALVYKTIRQKGRIDSLKRLFMYIHKYMNMGKFRVCLDILNEMSLVSKEPYTLNPTAQKVDIEKSAILGSLMAFINNKQNAHV